MRDTDDNIRVLVYSSYTTIAGVNASREQIKVGEGSCGLGLGFGVFMCWISAAAPQLPRGFTVTGWN